MDFINFGIDFGNMFGLMYFDSVSYSLSSIFSPLTMLKLVAWLIPFAFLAKIYNLVFTASLGGKLKHSLSQIKH